MAVHVYVHICPRPRDAPLPVVARVQAQAQAGNVTHQYDAPRATLAHAVRRRVPHSVHEVTHVVRARDRAELERAAYR